MHKKIKSRAIVISKKFGIIFPEKKGFTLLELLVTISIVSFISTLGVVQLKQNRDEAKNVNCNVNIEQYLKAFELVYDSTGEYPDPGDMGNYCLGDYEDDGCWDNNSYSENSTINNILQNYISLDSVCSEACGFEGALYACSDRTNDLCANYEIQWYINGASQSCGVGENSGSSGSCILCKYEQQNRPPPVAPF